MIGKDNAVHSDSEHRIVAPQSKSTNMCLPVTVQGTPLNTHKGTLNMSNGNRISFRVDDKEYKRIKDYSTSCGLSQSELMRFLSRNLIPKPLPPKQFWEFMDTLYSVHDNFSQCSGGCDNAQKKCIEIETLVLELQIMMTKPEEVESWRQRVCGTSTED